MNRAFEDAIARGDADAIRAQLRSGAEVDARDRHGQTALMRAAHAGHVDAVQALTEHGASLDLTAKFGLSAVMLAVVAGHADVARLLARAGADLSLRGTGAPGFAGKTARDLAIAAGLHELSVELEPSGRVEIRECTPDDSEGLHAVLDAVARERRFLARVEAPPVAAVRAFTESLRERGGVRLVALAADRIVGWCSIDPQVREGFRHGGVLDMGLLPAYRGQGHGRALLEAALDLARGRGISRVELEVFESNSAAIRLYDRLGFVREGVKLRARILDGRVENLVLMARLGDAGSP